MGAVSLESRIHMVASRGDQKRVGASALAICLMRLVHVTLTRDARSSFPIVALKSCPFGAHSLVLNSHSATEDGAFGFTDVPRI